MDEDPDLQIIEQRKLAALRKRAMLSSAPAKAEKTDRQVVEGVLYDRGDEVLATAYEYYPTETERMVREISRMVKDGKLRDRVSGGELYSIMRQLGLRFNLKTTIKVQDKGKFVDLSEKLRSRSEP